MANENKKLEKTERDPMLGSLTTEVKEKDGMQFVPRHPGAPRELDDFNPDGTVKNKELAQKEQMERAALLGEAEAPPFAPESEREYNKGPVEEEKVETSAPADNSTTKSAVTTATTEPPPPAADTSGAKPPE